ncbi:MAG: nicotinate-nucleotide adenylyltransferase [Chloroflexota bacterium]
MTRLGIFGGTFDPPHIGHLILAEEACYQLELERVLWVLTPNPPHKTDREITPAGERLAMLHAALAGAACFELSTVDLDRPAPHYAVDTVRLLRQKHPQARLVYLLGGDSLNDLTTWHNPQAFVDACDELGVMYRPGREVDLSALELALPGVAAKTRFLQAPLLEIASSQVRQRVAASQPFRYYLPEAVYQVIQRRGLYR